MSIENSSDKPSSTAKLEVDLLISAKWLATVDSDNTLLKDHTVVVNQGIIVDILPTISVAEKFIAKTAVELPNQLLIPGLINAHGHAGMALFRGYADDLPLMTWLNDHMWPAESAHVSHEFVHDGSQLAIAEMIKSGTTCFADMYFFPKATIEAAKKAGIRAYIAPPVFDFPSNWKNGSQAYIDAITKLALEQQNPGSNELITIAFGPHAPYTVSDNTFEAILTANQNLQLGVHIHVHETEAEVEQSIKQHGLRPLQRLKNLGVLSPKTQCVHMTQICDKDIEILKETATSVIHCPRSNMKLASGQTPIQLMRENGIPTGLGTDSAASNNSLNMISEMTQAALLAKVTANNAEALSAEQALQLATIDSAKALGLGHKIGSIEIGKQADITAVDLSKIAQQPVYSPLSSLVYSESSQSVSNVWINGKQLLENGCLTTVDESAVLSKTQQWREKLEH